MQDGRRISYQLKNKTGSLKEKIIKSKNLILVTISVLSLLYCLAVVIYGLDKNPETLGGDEFFYLLLSRHPNESVFFQGISEAHSIIHALVYKCLRWYDADILTFRLLKLFLILVSSITLSFGFWFWLKGRKLGCIQLDKLKFFNLIIFTLIGGLYSYSFDLPGVSYNSLTHFFLLTAGGFLMLGLSKKNSAWSFGVSGFFASFGLFSKVPSGLFFIVLFSLVTSTLSSPTLKVRSIGVLKPIAIFLVGFLIAVLTYHFIIQDLATWYSHLVVGTENITSLMSTYRISNRFVEYASSFLRSIVVVVIYFFPVHYGIYRLNRRPESGGPAILGISSKELMPALVILVVFCAQSCVLRKFLPNRISDSWTRPYLFIMAVGCCLLVATLPRNNNILRIISRESRSIDIAIILFLFLLPFAGSMGTAVSIMGHITMGLAPWFILIWLIAQVIEKYYSLLVGQMIIVATLLCTCVQLGLDSFSPNAYNLTAYRSTLPDNALLSRVKFKEDRIKVLLAIQNIIRKNGFRPGDAIIEWGAVMPLYVYMVSGVSPGNPSYSRRPMQMCLSLKQSNVSVASAYLMISDFRNAENSSNIPECWKEVGIEFPKNYKVIGKVTAPNVEGVPSSLTIYAPHSL